MIEEETWALLYSSELLLVKYIVLVYEKICRKPTNKYINRKRQARFLKVHFSEK